MRTRRGRVWCCSGAGCRRAGRRKVRSSTAGGGLIYDDVLKVTWLHDAELRGERALDARRTPSLSAGETRRARSARRACHGGPDFYKFGERIPGYMTGGGDGLGRPAAYGDFSDWRLPVVAPSTAVPFNYEPTPPTARRHRVHISAPGTVHAGATGSRAGYM